MKRLIAGRAGDVLVAVAAAMLMSSCVLEDKWRPTVEPPQLKGPLNEVLRAGESAADVPSLPAEGPIELTVEQAVLAAIGNNRALRVERLNPPIQRTFVQQELAAFDPVATVDAGVSRDRVEGAGSGEFRRTVTNVEGGLAQRLPTGTTVGLDASTGRDWISGGDDQHASRVGFSVTQALLEGRPVAVNLANVRQARVDELFSVYEFRGFAEALVAEVETTYWRLVLAERGVAIVVESLRLAEQQLEDTQQRIRVGQLAETELAAAKAEVALRREALINARSLVSSLRVRLLRLVYPDALPAWQRQVVMKTDPVVPPVPLEELADHVAVALKLRPELDQARLLIERGELEVVQTRNGLLPQLDLFVRLGRTGYAESFGRSVGDIDSDGYDVLVGLSFAQPIANRADRARHARSRLTVAQRQQSLENLRDLVRQDVELAYIEVARARQQVDATAATRSAQEEKVRAEMAKFRVGRSTALLVAAAQRDLLESQVGEVQAVANYLNARVDLYLAEGSLLSRRGLATGCEPGPEAAQDQPPGELITVPSESGNGQACPR
jgi:outer membrane protein TolC